MLFIKLLFAQSSFNLFRRKKISRKETFSEKEDFVAQFKLIVKLGKDVFLFEIIAHVTGFRKFPQNRELILLSVINRGGRFDTGIQLSD